MERNRRESADREIRIITADQEEYPQLLREIKGRPKQLYCIGDVGLLRTRCVSVVGSRTTTVYGRNTARAIARHLARRDITVVSGLAAGIDTCAHEGALEEQGRTIAVLGCGPDICYPAENGALKAAIERRGLVVSEYPPGTKPFSYNFPQRNRIISGLSELTAVVQARSRSGALITAECAAEQGRTLVAVPGNIDSQYNQGTNQLIRDGAVPLTTTEEILEYLGLGSIPEEDMAGMLSETEHRIYQLLKEGGEMSVDEVCHAGDFRAVYVLPILSSLELKGIIYSAAGKFFLANP